MSFVDTLLSWNNVTVKKLIVLIFITVIGIICIFYINLDFLNKYNLPNFNAMCFKQCNTNICKNLTQLRDSGYMLHSKEQPYDCIFTGWEFSHVILHMFLGYYYNIYVSITYSIVFELYEHYVHNCGSILDLFWNAFGMMIGVTIRYYMSHRSR